MRVRGCDPCDVTALIISHDHHDHVRCAGIYQRKFSISVYVTQRTLAAVNNLGILSDVRHFESGQTLSFGEGIQS